MESEMNVTAPREVKLCPLSWKVGAAMQRQPKTDEIKAERSMGEGFHLHSPAAEAKNPIEPSQASLTALENEGFSHNTSLLILPP